MTKFQLPQAGPAARPFTDPAQAARRVDGIALGLAFYILFVIYPGYELLHWMWNTEHELFAWQSVLTTVVVAVLFAAYARRTMRLYLSLRNKAS